MATIKTASFNGEVLSASDSYSIYDARGALLYTSVVADFSLLSSLTFSLHALNGAEETGLVGGAGATTYTLKNIYIVKGAAVDDTFNVTASGFTVLASEGDDTYVMNGLSTLSYAGYSTSLTFDLNGMYVGGKVGGHQDVLTSLPGTLVLTNFDDSLAVDSVNVINAADGGGNVGLGDMLSWTNFAGGATISLQNASGDGIAHFSNFELFQGSDSDDTFSAAAGLGVTTFTIVATEGNDTYALDGQGTLTYGYYANGLVFDFNGLFVSGKVGGATDSLASLPGTLVATAYDDVVYLDSVNTIASVDGGNQSSLGDLLSWSYFSGGATISLQNASGDGVAHFQNFEGFEGSASDDTFTAAAGLGVTVFTILASEGNDTYALDGQGTLTYADYATGLLFDMDVAGAVVNGKAGGASDGLASLPGSLVLTTHNDSFFVDDDNAIGSVDAGAGIDTLNFEHVAGGATVNIGTGSANGVGSFSNFENLVGSAAADTFLVSDGRPVVSIDGAGGSDTLDFRFVAGAAHVNLDNRTATGISGTFTSIENFIGSRIGDTFTASTATGFTLLGSGGNDTYDLNGKGTLSYAGTDSPLVIDLTLGSVTGKINGGHDTLVGLAPKTIIGSDGNDVFIPATTGNETLDGGNGFDVTELSGTRASWSIINNHDGSGTAHKGAQTITLTHMEALKFSDTTVSLGFSVQDDLYGVGRSATFWQAAAGDVWVWNNHGTSSDGYTGALGVIDPSWHAVGLGDLNGDGRADVVWHNVTSGEVWYWFMNGSDIQEQGNITSAGVPVYLPAASPLANGVTWAGLGVRDFDGDGHADILWQGSDGSVYEWSMNGNAIIDQGVVGNKPADVPLDGGGTSSFSVLGYGDVNGDAKMDVVWYDEAANQVQFWFMNGHAKTVKSVSLDAAFKVQGVGDFNGDGTADLVGRAADGSVMIATTGRNVAGVGTGNIASLDFVDNLDASWTISQVNDYNGDGFADILFINTDGNVWVWEMNGTAIIGQGSAGTIDMRADWVLHT